MRRSTAGLVALGLLAGGAAAAADRLPPAPVPRLGACGGVTGGFLIPGTDGCLRIGGSVSVEGRWTSALPVVAFPLAAAGPLRVGPAVPDLGRSGLGTAARLSADLRLPTELGPMRVFVSLRGHNGLAADRDPR